MVLPSGDSPFVPAGTCFSDWRVVPVLWERLPLVQDECQVMAAPLSEDCGLQVCRDIPACWFRRPGGPFYQPFASGWRLSFVF